jgi:antitoxin (DNA-binding transcriptional repressor) of toxin-antitoxin stability system
MLKVNIHEAKTHASQYLADLHELGVIVICRRTAPIAEIRPVSTRPHQERPIGLGAGEFQVPDSFFEPLPASVVDAFEGRG